MIKPKRNKREQQYNDFVNFLDYHFAEIQSYIRSLNIGKSKEIEDLKRNNINKCIMLNHELKETLGDYI